MRDDGAAMNCYLLIGGESRRMGRSKVELFLERTIAVARPAFDEVIAVQREGEAAAAVETISNRRMNSVRRCSACFAPCSMRSIARFVLAVDYPC